MPRRIWFLFLALSPGLLALDAARPKPSPAAPAPPYRKPAVEVVFCLDTTGSMSGMIDAAKTKIWAICNQFLNGRPTPELKVGLVAFRDKGDEYITRVYDLRDDLDAVYGDLSTFVATGGGDTPESVNQALDDSVNKIKWSTDKKTLRIIFLVGDAEPHMDYPDDVKYPVTCKKAVEKGILINTVQCGNDPNCTKYWKDICEKAGGAYVAIPLAGGVRTITTPMDKRLAEINTELTKNTLVFGEQKKKEVDNKKLDTASKLPEAVAADRACYLAKEGKAARYDLLDCIRSGAIKLDTLRLEELPTDMQKMTHKERRDYIDKIARQRARLLREAQELDRERNKHVAKALEENKDSFDRQVIEILRKQARKRIRY
jgi:Mg-chelatase subunit ChlD